MEPELIFHLTFAGLIGGCILACGVGAFFELRQGSFEWRAYQRHKRRMRSIKRRAELRRARLYS